MRIGDLFTLTEPDRLWFGLAFVALLVAYVLLQRQRAVYAVRLASAEMFDSIVPKRPGWRRHATAATFALALLVLLAGFAKPAREIEVAKERATIIVAIDVSLSMEADDVDPNRLVAAQSAAVNFISSLPDGLNVGLVSFAGNANVLVPPTTQRNPTIRAIEGLQLAPSTAIGEAIFTSLDALQSAPPNEDGTLPPARIILLSDGETTVGRSDSLAITAAVNAEVPVSTIAFGTPNGQIEFDDPETEAIERDVYSVPVADENLETIADATGGRAFSASSLEELSQIYDDIGSDVGFEVEFTEITDWFLGAGLLLLGLSSLLSLWWFQRLP